MLSADHVYKADYTELIEDHLASDGVVTMATTEVPVEEASRYGVLEVEADQIVGGFEYKPDHPKTGTVTTEVFLYDTEILLDRYCATLERPGRTRCDRGRPRRTLPPRARCRDRG